MHKNVTEYFCHPLLFTMFYSTLNVDINTFRKKPFTTCFYFEGEGAETANSLL